MLLIVLGSAIAAMSLVTLILIAMCRAGRPLDEARERMDPRESGRALGSWEEITQRTDRWRPQRSSSALRRRHLAAVLPADARR
jgi:hypothetical protein